MKSTEGKDIFGFIPAVISYKRQRGDSGKNIMAKTRNTAGIICSPQAVTNIRG